MKENYESKEEKLVTNLKQFFETNFEEIGKYLIELLEFQEGIKFINPVIEKKNE